MNFDNQTLTTLRSHAGQNNHVVLSVINKIGQEFTVQGYIPKAYSRYNGHKVTTNSVTPEGFLVKFADDQYSLIKIYDPKSTNSLNLKSVSDLNGNIIYNNPHYELQKLEALTTVEDLCGRDDFFTEFYTHHNIAKNLVGKVVVYKKSLIPDMDKHKCLITYVKRTKIKDVAEVGLIYGRRKSIVLVNLLEFENDFDFVQAFENELTI